MKKYFFASFSLIIFFASIFLTVDTNGFRFARAEETANALSYLDYSIEGATDIYCDSDLVAVVTDNGITVYSGNSVKSIEKNFVSNFTRVGDYFYYFDDMTVCRNSLSLDNEQIVNTANGNINGTSFSFFGSRLIVSTNKTLKEYALDDDYLPTGEPSILLSQNIEFSRLLSDGSIVYYNDEKLKKLGDDEYGYTARIKYLCENSGKIYYTNENGLFELGKAEPLIESANLRGLTFYNENLLIVDSADRVIKKYNLAEKSLSVFVLKADIHIDNIYLGGATELKIISVESGKKLYKGGFNAVSGDFGYNAYATSDSFECVVLGDVDDYWLVNNNGYALIKKADAVDKTAESITENEISSGFLSSSIALYTAPVSADGGVSDRFISEITLNKGDEIVINKLVMVNGKSFYEINFDSGNYYVPTTFVLNSYFLGITENKTSEVFENPSFLRTSLIIFLVSLSVFISTLYVINMNKEIVKL